MGEATRRDGQVDDALMAALRIGRFVLMTTEDGSTRQGWLHLHHGIIWCCFERERVRCEEEDRATRAILGREPAPRAIATTSIVRIEQSLIRSGRYVTLWQREEMGEEA